MSSTLFSKPVVAVDIPEVKIIGAAFNYNFFTPDESISENDDIVAPIGTQEQALRGTPRYVSIDFQPGTTSLIAETPEEQAVDRKSVV